MLSRVMRLSRILAMADLGQAQGGPETGSILPGLSGRAPDGHAGQRTVQICGTQSCFGSPARRGRDADKPCDAKVKMSRCPADFFWR